MPKSQAQQKTGVEQPNSSRPEVSTRTYVLTWLALMILLAITAGAALVNLGTWNSVISVTVAVLKALLIILFFMHVRYSKRLVWVFAGAGFVWLGILLNLTLNDYFTRGWLHIPGK